MRIRRRPGLRFVALGLLLSCATEPVDPVEYVCLRLEPVASGFTRALFLLSPPNDARLFVLEKAGRVRIIKGGEVRPAPFLDISSQITTNRDRGLQGMAFHPAYATNGRFFVFYTDLNGDMQVDSYTAAANADVANAASRVAVLKVPNPGVDHHGGMMEFGPDGYLWISTGDGGAEGDFQKAAQDSSSLAGKILRIDVDHGAPYAVPASNPFVGRAGFRPEIWGRGLRNSFRFSIDSVDNLIYVGDVGNNAWEEVSVAALGSQGANFGWNVMEGPVCAVPGCNVSGFTMPAVSYDHDDGCAVLGGYVYRGTASPELAGTYFYSDFCEGFLRSFRYTGSGARNQRHWSVPGGKTLSFGRDAAGELYLLRDDGVVYRIGHAPRTADMKPCSIRGGEPSSSN